MIPSLSKPRRHLILLAAMLLTACASAFTLPLPEVPRSLTSPEERAAFIASHFWDGMEWNDTTLLHSEQFLGESMATYGTILGIADREKATEAVNSLIGKIGHNTDALNAIADFSYSYFYHPESPLYDEEVYLLFIDPLLSSEDLPEENAERLKVRKEGIMKNRKGSVATDFQFVGTDGEFHTLHRTPLGSEFTILMFYAPECEVCERAFRTLNGSVELNRMLQNGSISVIAINAYGQEHDGAALRKPGMQDNWTVGYSPEGKIDSEEIYLIRTTPAIYILDNKGIIVEKNISLDRLSSLLKNV